MTERNTTVVVSVLATSAMWEVLIYTPRCYGWYGLSLSFTHAYILTFSYFQNLKNLALAFFIISHMKGFVQLVSLKLVL